MNKSKVGVGVIGTGWGSQVMIPALRCSSDIEIVAVGAAHLDRAQEAARKFDIAAAFDDVRELARCDAVDLVCVCTPPATHHDITLSVLEAGRNVFVTKPLAPTVREAAEMRDAAAARGVVHAIDSGGRYVPTYRYIRDLVADGFLGELRFVSNTCFNDDAETPGSVIYYSNWVSKRPFGGMLQTSFRHLVDRMRFMFGELDEIRGSTSTLVREKPVLGAEYRSTYGLDGGGARVVGMEPADADDTVMMQGTFRSGGLYNVTSSWGLPHGGGDRIEAYGSDGALVLDASGVLYAGTAADSELRVLPVPDAYTLRALPTDASPYELLFFGGRPSLYAEFMQDLADVILGRPNLGLHPTFDDGLRLAEVEAAVLDSAP